MIEHNFKKKFGQNFITDTNLLSAIVKDAGVTGDDEVLEIGAGAGALTEVLDRNAKKVVSYEIDRDLEYILLQKNLKSTNFIFGDIMKYDIEEIEKNFEGDYKLIANLPYYITTPLLFKFLNGSRRLRSITVMVQKEVAERIVAIKGGKDYGVLSIMVRFFGDARITRIVSRNLFYPKPNVDSAIVNIEIKNKYTDVDRDKFYNFIKACFSMRRKTLRNNLSHSLNLSSDKLTSALTDSELSSRAENFSLEELVQMFKKIEY